MFNFGPLNKKITKLTVMTQEGLLKVPNNVLGHKQNLCTVESLSNVLDKMPATRGAQNLFSFFKKFIRVSIKYRLDQLRRSGKRRFNPITKLYSSSYLLAIAKRFFEYSLQSRAAIFINFELIHRLANTELVFLTTVKSRLRASSYRFSTIFFLNEFIDMVYLSLKLKNFNLMIDYLNKILKNLVI